MIDTWRFFRHFLFYVKHDWSALGEDHAGTTTKPRRGQEKRMVAALAIKPNSQIKETIK
jgi:hypothetical protein